MLQVNTHMLRVNTHTCNWPNVHVRGSRKSSTNTRAESIWKTSLSFSKKLVGVKLNFGVNRLAVL